MSTTTDLVKALDDACDVYTAALATLADAHTAEAFKVADAAVYAASEATTVAANALYFSNRDADQGAPQ
jgi:hypothetical protein